MENPQDTFFEYAEYDGCPVGGNVCSAGYPLSYLEKIKIWKKSKRIWVSKYN